MTKIKQTREFPNDVGNLRRSAVVSTFGPGAIVDFRAGGAPISAVAGGLEEWDSNAPPAGIANAQTIFEPRLQKKLAVKGFRVPPVYPDNGSRTGSLVAVRFPRWLQCPSCHIIQQAKRWTAQVGRAERACGTCSADQGGAASMYAVPVRFVTACERGHLDEFPWHWWVQHKEGCINLAKSDAPLQLASEGAGLAGLIVRCDKCKAHRSMDGTFSKEALAGLKCRGRRPWIGDSESCGERTRVVQRGASNLYFPVIQSALDIPPWSDTLQKALGQFWDSIIGVSDPEQREVFIRILHPQLGISITPEELARQISIRVARIQATNVDDLRQEEYLQFTTDNDFETGNEDFEIQKTAVPEIFSPHISSVMRALRIREVRAQSAFTRIHPPSDVDATKYAAIQRGRLPWLPAVEVRGEGIFIRLADERLRRWEEQPEIVRIGSDINSRFGDEWRERQGVDSSPTRSVTARFLLIHTLAHVLIRELALECGYSSASLRERLYVGHGESIMAGVLIYTASSDADGTLGGLARQGQPERLHRTLRRALASAIWCSSDPLCSRGLMSAPENMSGAACHACVLVAETSCEEFNRFLDRRFLIDPTLGYFADVAGT
jgi:hypothetical protein